jgi:hypothetical protein
MLIFLAQKMIDFRFDVINAGLAILVVGQRYLLELHPPHHAERVASGALGVSGMEKSPTGSDVASAGKEGAASPGHDRWRS